MSLEVVSDEASCSHTAGRTGFSEVKTIKPMENSTKCPGKKYCGHVRITGKVKRNNEGLLYLEGKGKERG